MRRIPRLTLLASIAVGMAVIASACSSAAATPGAAGAPGAAGLTIGTTTDSTLGAFLTGQNSMTLYVLTKDTPDTATCTGSCATNWPPLTVASGVGITGPSSATGAFATITRSDGVVQVTYNHMPLYYYAGDSKAGDTNGQGKDGTWFVAPLSGSVASMAPASAPASTAAGNPAPTPVYTIGY